MCILLASMMSCSSASKKEKDGTMIVNQDSVTDKGLQCMQRSEAKASFEYKGKKYESQVVRRPDETLPVVTNEQGERYADNRIRLRLVMGGRDLENNTMEIMRRDTLEKETRSCDGIEQYVKDLLEEIQQNIYRKALSYRNSKITSADTYEEFKQKIEEGGFVMAHWDGTTETEEKIKEETKATIRCIPFDTYLPGDKEPGKCMVTGKPSPCRVVFARSY